MCSYINVLAIMLLLSSTTALSDSAKSDAPVATSPVATKPAVPAPAPARKADEPLKPPPLDIVKVSLPKDTSTPSSDPVVAERGRRGEEERQLARRASLGESIVLTTSPRLGEYMDFATKKKKPATLFLNGIDTGVVPEEIDRNNATLQFRLDRNGDNKKVWEPLLRDPFHHHTRTVEASIGIAGESAPVEGASASFTLVVMQWAWYAWAWLILLIVLLLVFAWLAARRDLLRDGPAPHPYSLGRCQMAWWFFMIVVSYVMIWLISGDRDTITPSLLALMGISAGTALGAVLIDSTQGSASISQAAADRLALQAAQENAKNAEAVAQTAVNAQPTDQVLQKILLDAQATSAGVAARLFEVNNRISGIVTAPQSRGLLRDIMGDSNGTAGLHRFQIVVWTIVLGIIFLVSVVMELSMPEFSNTLLAALGISAGTYLGFKFPEK